MMKYSLGLVVILVVVIGANCFAQVEVAGNIEGRWTVEDSPYIVTGNITIRNDDELIIDPGVEIRFEQDRSLLVYGLITAVGEDDNRILFTAEN